MQLQNRSQAVLCFLNMQREILSSVLPRVRIFERITPEENQNSHALLSTSWPQPIAHFPASKIFECRRIFDIRSSITPHTLAWNFLSPAELDIWFSLSGLEKRRLEWLSGRIAAKDAIRVFLHKKFGTEVSPTEFEIVPDERGRPVALGEPLEKLGSNTVVSIAHSGGMAAAIAGECSGHNGVGVDIECTYQNHSGIENRAFSLEEQDLISAIPPRQRGTWILQLWCAKEAVVKALGCGMGDGPLSVLIKGLELQTGRVTVGLSGKLIRKFPAFEDALFAVYTGRNTSFVFASTVI